MAGQAAQCLLILVSLFGNFAPEKEIFAREELLESLKGHVIGKSELKDICLALVYTILYI